MHLNLSIVVSIGVSTILVHVAMWTRSVESRQANGKHLSSKLPNVEAEGAAHRRVTDIDELSV